MIYYEETRYRNQSFRVPLLVLRSNPCRWFVSGGCVMCNFMLEAAAYNQLVTGADLLEQLEYALRELPRLSDIPYMLVTTAGSFLSDAEVDAQTRLRILTRLDELGLGALSFESEAKYCIRIDTIAAVRKAFRGSISVGIGVESWDTHVRNVALNKGLTLTLLERACSTLRSNDIGYYHYLLMGKPFLGPNEELGDAIHSVTESLRAGSFMIVLRLTNIQPSTLTHYLWKTGRFSPPNIWLAYDLLCRLDPAQRPNVSIKGIYQDEVAPLSMSSGCELCTPRVREALREWNLHRDFDLLTSSIGTCDCRPKVEPCAVSSETHDRISSGMRAVAAELGI